MSRHWWRDNVLTVMAIAATIVQGLFVALKLLGLLRWSWWLVLAPAWAAVLLILAVCGLMMLILKRVE